MTSNTSGREGQGSCFLEEVFGWRFLSQGYASIEYSMFWTSHWLLAPYPDIPIPSRPNTYSTTVLYTSEIAFLFLVFFVIWLPEFYGLPVFGLHNPINYKRSNGLGHPFCLQLARSHFISISRSPDLFLSKILFTIWRPLMSFIWDKLSVFQGVCPKDFSAISCHQAGDFFQIHLLPELVSHRNLLAWGKVQTLSLS